MAEAPEEDMTPEELLDAIRSMVKQQGERWTQQRAVIITEVIRSEEHLTTEELLALARERDASVSMTTVYRTMNLLVDLGVVAKRQFNQTSARFELLLGKGHHHHLIDTDSGAVIEFLDDELEVAMQRIARELGYEIACHRIEIFGKPLERRPRKGRKKTAG
ncbi:MAG: Fur family transcriptional regulator [Planctomycetota bacterium]